MIEFDIPGRGLIKIKNIVFDVNGTVAMNGRIDYMIKKKLVLLSQKAEVFLLTADTYGTIEKEMGKTGIKIHKISSPGEAEEKEDFIKQLGGKQTIAIGNGANDSLMLKRAVIGICVIDKEGAASSAVSNADIVIYGKETVFDLLKNPKRIIATLRL
ncbi:HAD family hydrolase [candidate division WOR-3 bacterium]|nr:HAD family hydrolase [candidate division WOR-3 bacterium]